MRAAVVVLLLAAGGGLQPYASQAWPTLCAAPQQWNESAWRDFASQTPRAASTQVDCKFVQASVLQPASSKHCNETQGEELHKETRRS